MKEESAVTELLLSAAACPGGHTGVVRAESMERPAVRGMNGGEPERGGEGAQELREEVRG